MHTTPEVEAGSFYVCGSIAAIKNKSTSKYLLFHNFDVSSICSLITVTGDIPKEFLLGKKEATEVCVHVLRAD